MVDSGWTFFHKTGLYYRHFESRQSWAEARCSCQLQGQDAELASVPDNTTNTFILNLAPRYTWLGGYQENGTEDGAPWSWSDGSVWEFENWRNGEPNNVGGHQDYLGIWAEKWNDWPLDGHLDSQIPILGFLCQKKGHY